MLFDHKSLNFLFKTHIHWFLVLINFKFKQRSDVLLFICQWILSLNFWISFLNFNSEFQNLNFYSDGWADRPDVLGTMVDSRTQRRALSDHVLGGISIRLHSPKVPDFDEYFWSLKPRANNPNPWFNEFWEQKFNCTFKRGLRGVRMCTGELSLSVSLSVWLYFRQLRDFYRSEAAKFWGKIWCGRFLKWGRLRDRNATWKKKK